MMYWVSLGWLKYWNLSEKKQWKHCIITHIQRFIKLHLEKILQMTPIFLESSQPQLLTCKISWISNTCNSSNLYWHVAYLFRFQKTSATVSYIHTVYGQFNLHMFAWHHIIYHGFMERKSGLTFPALYLNHFF